ncbi:MAG: Eco57I restriction-modification methylase domain-containing protein [Acetobacteraceae bacterium]|nr:Eco57I restriction-modification methylase domain-containing protein [Acetobacteraceae bacterium]
MARVGQQLRLPDITPEADQKPFAARAEALAMAAIGIGAHAAQTMAHAAAIAWWRARVEAAGGNPDLVSAAAFTGPLLKLPEAILTEAKNLGRDIAALPVAEGCAELGRLYTHLLPSARRAAEGIYYTPPMLVRRLLNKAEWAGHDWLTGSAIDPSCGGGAFLVEGATRTAAAMPNAEPAIMLAAIAGRLRGWDIDPLGCWLAQIVVEAVLLPQIILSGKRLPQITECRDALKYFEKGKGQFGLVMGNPAFGKIKKTAEMGRKFARSLYGHPNLYGMLTDVAVHLAKADSGIIAYLTPTSYLSGEYFKNLRKLLAEEARPVSIDIVESRTAAFTGVLQEVALSCLKRGRTENRAACSVIHVDADGLRVDENGALVLPPKPGEPWILPRSKADAALVERLAQMPTRLRDWGYRVSTGPLVWNRHKERLHSSRAPGRYPVIWAEAVTTDGKFSLQAAKSNHRERAWFTPSKTKDPNLVRKGAC